MYAHLDTTIGMGDQAQVRGTVDWIYEWDKAGKLDQLMQPPAWMSPEMIDDAVSEEGWVIGSGLDGNIFH